MRILWTINSLMPKVAAKLGFESGHAISWVDAMSIKITQFDNVSLAMATIANVNKMKIYDLDGVRYYILPMNCDKIDYWLEIISDFQPDIIHAYGTEGKHNILLFNHKDLPIIVSLQGILTEYQHHYYAGIDFSTMLRFTALQDLFVPTGFFSGRNSFIKRSKNEQKQLLNVKYVEGRSTWDRVSSMNINPNLRYYFCPRMIREPFFNQEWSIDRMERHTLFVSQAVTPLKGLHFVFEAIAKLKRKYPDIKLYVAGYDRLHPTKLRQKLSSSGYMKFLKYLIKKLDIDDLIHFTGTLSAEEMAIKMASVNVVIIPSSIENAPNSLAEATIIGVPCIASFVGGNMDMLEHNTEGFLYCYNESNMLAEYISRIFESDELAQKFSTTTKVKYRKKHDPDILINTLLNIYKDVIKHENKQ